jgi:signal transduction histidine kinase
MRTLLMTLRPEAIREAALPDLLQHLGTAVGGRTGVEVRMSLEEPSVSLPPLVRIVFYRIAQEAMNNVAKYARATQIAIKFGGIKNGAELSVEDNGVGFDLNTVSSDHLGLTIMRERAAEIGASLAVDTLPGQGTVITARWLAESWHKGDRNE